MILVLRGHIRKSFTTDKLKQLIEWLILRYPNLVIYIHTWNLHSSGHSWRDVKDDRTEVNEELINDYFGNLSKHIKHMIIEDDTSLELHGCMEGCVCKTLAPVVGWKRYWHGKYTIAKYLYDTVADLDTPVINTRFDLYQNGGLPDRVITKFLMRVCSRVYSNPQFVSDKTVPCIDNIYLSTVSMNYEIAKKFHFELDDIMERNPDVVNQEVLLLYVCRELFNKNDILENDIDRKIPGEIRWL